jgi:hypothetical protein
VAEFVQQQMLFPFDAGIPSRIIIRRDPVAGGSPPKQLDYVE